MPPFALALPLVANRYFVVTGIQFWVTDYLVTFLDADPNVVVAGFALSSLTGPTAGVFFGGTCPAFMPLPPMSGRATIAVLCDVLLTQRCGHRMGG